MIVREVEGVDRIRVGGRGRHLRIQEDRGVGPRRPDGGTVPVHRVARDAAAGGRPREGDPCRGHAGGREVGGGGGRHGRRGGIGVEDGAYGVPFGGGVAEGGRSVLGAGGARGDVLCERVCIRGLHPRRERYAPAASRPHRGGRDVGHQGREHELARIHRRGEPGVDGRSLVAVRGGDLRQRAGEGDARILGDRALEVCGRGDGYGNGQPTGRRPAVLAVVEGDVTRVVIEGQRSGRHPRPGAVHVVRHLALPGGVVLRKPPDQQIALGHRAGECDGVRRESGGRERRRLDEGRGGERRVWKGSPQGDDRGQAGHSRR